MTGCYSACSQDSMAPPSMCCCKLTCSQTLALLPFPVVTPLATHLLSYSADRHHAKRDSEHTKRVGSCLVLQMCRKETSHAIVLAAERLDACMPVLPESCLHQLRAACLPKYTSIFFQNAHLAGTL